MKTVLLFFSLLFIFTSCEKEHKIQQLFKDRPQMKVENSSRLYREAEKVLEIMVWRGRIPQEPHSSQITLGGEMLLKEDLSFIEAWICFFYESQNYRSRDLFESLWKMGYHGKLSRQEWVRQNAGLELKAGKDFLYILDTLLIPEFIEMGIEPDSPEVRKYREIFSQSIEDWMSSPQDTYPWNFWGNYYDEYFSKKLN